MTRTFAVGGLLLFSLVGPALAQEQDPQYFSADRPSEPSKAETNRDDVELLTRPIPHPYVCIGPSLMAGGYAPLAYRAEAGIDLESTHTVVRALGAYDNGHKTDDGDQPLSLIHI